MKFVPALALACLVVPAAGADDALLTVSSSRFDDEGRQAFLRGRIATTLPDGGLVNVSVRYGGATIPTLRQRFRIAGGAVEFELGPCTKRILSGVYVVAALYEHDKQPRAYWKILDKAGIRAPERFEAAGEVVVRQRELTPEEREEIDEHFRTIHDGTSVLLEETLRFRDLAQEEFDEEEFARWKAGLDGRIRDLGRRYEALFGSYLALPEPGLALSMGAIFQHLSYIVSEAGRGPKPARKTPEVEREDLTLEDRLHHVRQVLRGLAIHLGKVEMDDAATFAALRKELAPLLDELEARARAEKPPEEAARTEWFDGWSPRVASLAQGIVVAESGEGLHVEFRRLRRDVIAAGEAWRATGELPDTTELRKRVEVE